MTLRAIILGLLGAVLLAAVGYLNDSVWRLNFVVGNHFPLTVFGLLLVVLTVVNPLLAMMRPGWGFRPGELAVALALVLAACAVPGGSMMRTFTPMLMMPGKFLAEPGPAGRDVPSYIPPRLLVNGGRYDPRILSEWRDGVRPAERPIGIGQVPWGLWRGPLETWLPLVALMSVGLICMTMIVHRQWTSHERLRYPVAEFATALLSGADGRAGGSVLRGRLFWIGLSGIFLVQGVNGLHSYFPQCIEIPLWCDFRAIQQKVPVLANWQGEMALWFQVYPMVAAFAYLLSSEVSLSLGASTLAIAVVLGMQQNDWLGLGGLDMSGLPMGGGPVDWMRLGSYLGLAMMLLYTGRHYYGRVARAAVGLGRSGLEGYAPWAFRILLLCAAGMTAMFCALGVPVVTALLAVAVLLLVYLGMARLMAEAGLIFMGPWLPPTAALIGLLGYQAIGPTPMAVLAFAGGVLALDSREALIPFVVNGLRICDNQGVRPGPIGWASCGAFLLALAVAVPTALWANYNFGADRGDWFAMNIPNWPVVAIDRTVSDLHATGQLESSRHMDSWQVLTHATPDRRFGPSLAVGAGVVLVCSVLRLRLPWWPLHPLMFLVWGTWTMCVFSASFLVGWAIKAVVRRVGGSRGYAGGKELMMGVIAGDALAGLVFMAVGAVQYFLTGVTSEKVFRVLPG